MITELEINSIINNIEDKEIKLVASQLKYIMVGDKIDDELRVLPDKYKELQLIIDEHERGMIEGNQFLVKISNGDLADDAPEIKNKYYIGLVNLFDNLKHMFNQVEHMIAGDYSKKLDENNYFSSIYNELIDRLNDATELQKEQSKFLSANNILLEKVINKINERIIITDPITKDVLFTNKSANEEIFKTCTYNYNCLYDCKLFEYVSSMEFSDSEFFEYEYFCEHANKFFLAKSYNIHWDQQIAYIHFISDITHEKSEKEKIREIMFIDELTNVYNRRYGMDYMDKMMRQDESFSFCMIDIDKLKYANDTYGHAKGDIYIQSVAHELVSAFSNDDVIFRLGGDEFAIISKNTNSDMLDDLLFSVNQKLTYYTEAFPMSISYGSISTNFKDNNSFLTIMHLADKKMYDQKLDKKLIQQEKMYAGN